MDFTFVFTKLCVLFLAIAAGYFAAKRGLFPAHSAKTLSDCVVFLVNPAMVLASALGNSHLLSNAEIGYLTLIAFACYAFLIGSAKLIVRLLRIPKEEERLYRFMYIFSNIGFFGMPVVQSLFGADAVLLVSVFMLPFQGLTFTYGITLIAADQEKRRFSFKMLLHPMIVTTLLSYVIYLSGLRVPQFISESISFLGQAASPLAMLVVGITLAGAPLKKVFGNGKLYLMLFIKMLLVPLLLLFFLRRILPDTESNRLIIAVSLTVMAMPTAANTTILSAQYGGDVETASCGVFLATVISALTIPLLMTLL